jgi:hypothetical protein
MRKTRKYQKDKMSKEITIALVTALTTGVLGIIGISITAYFSYKGLLVPLEATQTAEAMIATLVSSQLDSSAVTLPTDIPTAIKTISQTSTALSSSSQTLISEDDFIRIAELLPGDMCYSKVLPSEFDPYTDLEQVTEEIYDARHDGRVLNWFYSAAGSIQSPFYVIYSMTNVSETSNEWVILENRALVSVKFEEIPEMINVVDGECGGGGSNRMFTPIYLSADASVSQNLITKNEDFDYFSLKPGESEMLEIPYICSDPGMYTITISFPYSYVGQQGAVQVSGDVKIVCPNIYAQWMFSNVSGRLEGKYRFSNGEYLPSE